MTPDVETNVERVADHLATRDMRDEDWEKGAAVNGLLAHGDDRSVQAARTHVEYAMATQTSAGVLNHDDPKPWLGGEDPHRAQCEPATMAQGALAFYERTGEDRFLEAARRQYEFLVEEATRTADGGIAYSTGPAALWVDSVYMVCPFFARYGALTGEVRAFAEAAQHVLVQSKHLQDPHTGLFRHEWRETPNTYPESSLWARGNGWALAGAIDALAHLPDDHPDREAVVDVMETQAAALLELQDDSGLWHHILDYPDSPLETSATLQYAYAFARGTDLGILGDDAYRTAAEDALAAANRMVDRDGRVERVAVPPGGPDAPLGVTSYGQGWFLMAAARLAEE
jgi:unsaturated rhamnogalacturonyl hydrolase